MEVVVQQVMLADGVVMLILILTLTLMALAAVVHAQQQWRHQRKQPEVVQVRKMVNQQRKVKD
jgi:hypothetical protein